MHILLSVLGVAGTLAILIWRIRLAAEVTGTLFDAAVDLRLFARRILWRRKVNRDLFKTIEDPREAAGAMMAAVAQYDGVLSEREHQSIIDQMVLRFGCAEKVAEEFLVRGRWHVRDSKNLGGTLRRLAPAINQACTPDERQILIAMLLEVANADGEPNRTDINAIASLSRRIN